MANFINKEDEYVLKIIHDIKNPIIAQITALESFLSTASNKISQEELDLIKLTLNSCNYMFKLIEIFNSVYNLNFEPLKLNYEKFDVVKMINSSIAELKILLKYYELNLYFDCKDEIIINADKLQIKKVIENLLSNSINYAFKNSEIRVNASVVDGKLLFEIKNNSPYISFESLKEVFNKHKTLALYNKNGIGLGLYLSKEIINAHNGIIIAKSYPEDISIFGFEVPLGE